MTTTTPPNNDNPDVHMQKLQASLIECMFAFDDYSAGLHQGSPAALKALKRQVETAALYNAAIVSD